MICALVDATGVRARSSTLVALVALLTGSGCPRASGGVDAGPQPGGPSDSGVAVDAGDADGGVRDAGTEDGGVADAGVDAGTVDAGPKVCSGSFTVQNSNDLAEVIDCNVITGDITFTGNGLPDVQLPNLTEVDGSFAVTLCPDMTRMPDAPNLSTVGIELHLESAGQVKLVDYPALASCFSVNLGFSATGPSEVHLPALANSDSISVRGENNILTPFATFELGPVASLPGGFGMVALSSYTALDLHSLQSIGALFLLDMPDLTAVDLSALETCPSFEVTGLPKLQTLDVPVLAHADTQFIVGAGSADSNFGFKNAALVTVAAASLATSGNLLVEDNPVLATLTLDALAGTSGDFIVEQDPLLPTCSVNAILAHTSVDGGTLVSGNNDAATCP